jgi:hypothetical protein
VPNEKNGLSLDAYKLASAYRKDNAQNLINNSNVIYVEQNKKRVKAWEKRTGLQLPVGISSSNSINDISQSFQKSNKKDTVTQTFDGTNAPETNVQDELASPVSKNIINNSDKNVKKSAKEQIDSEGNKLSEQQQECYKVDVEDFDKTEYNIVNTMGLKGYNELKRKVMTWDDIK